MSFEKPFKIGHHKYMLQSDINVVYYLYIANANAFASG